VSRHTRPAIGTRIPVAGGRIRPRWIRWALAKGCLEYDLHMAQIYGWKCPHREATNPRVEKNYRHRWQDGNIEIEKMMLLMVDQ